VSTSAAQLDREVAHQQVMEVVRQLLVELGSTHALGAVRPEAHLEKDLALGSLERVELITRVGQLFSVTLPDQLVAEAATVADLTSAVLRAAGNGAGAASSTDLLSSPLAALRRHAETPERFDRAALATLHTLNDALDYHARIHPAQPHIFLRDDDGSAHQITYGELHQRASAVAAALTARGLGPRQTVAIMLPTCREFFYSFFGVLLAGGVPVPIYPPFRADRIEEYAARQAAILSNAEARFLLTFRRAETVAKLLKPRVPTLQGVLSAAALAESDNATTGSGNGSAPVALPAGAHAYRPRGDSIAFLQYTSGSTGEPKGVTLTHANLLANIRAIAEAVDIRDDDGAVSWLPLYHDMGLIGAWLWPLYNGIPVAILSPLSFLTRPERWLWAFHHHRGTITAAPNFAFELCVRKIADKEIEGLDLSSLRAALNGAEQVSSETMERFSARFAPYGFRREAMLPVYGLAEASLAVTVPPLGRPPRVDRIQRDIFQHEGRAVPAADDSGRGDDPPGRPPALATDSTLAFVSAGCAIPRHEVRIVDPDGNPLADRVEGQLWFRGPSTTQGYYRNPEATKEIMRDDGWVDSGDRAYTADGEVFITGRVKDIIIKGGRNLYPHEVEEVVGAVPAVRKGCVVAFGATDARTGTERLVVVAEARERAPGAAARNSIAREITARVDEALGLPPDVVELVAPGSIPKTSSGKLRRNETKRLFLAGRLGRSRPPMWVQVARLGAASGVHSAKTGARKLSELLFGLWAAVAFAVFLVPTWFFAYIAPSRASASRITQIGTRIFFRLIGCRIRLRGLEHLRPGQNYVFVSNHTSFLDVVLFLAILKRTYRFVSKIEVASWPFIGTFIRRREDFAFKREDPEERLKQAAALEDVLRQGESLLIFPEGTFVAHEGLRAFQLGAFKAAVNTGVPVCPIALQGVRQILRDETTLPRPGSITVTFCPPIAPHANPGASDWHEIVRLRDAARSAIAAHCAEPVL
jgi:1-acyl-sn-glycerol-3-phosphate acyltransferase